jgi:hypothetical protein
MTTTYNQVITAPQVFTKHPDEEWTDDAQKQMDFSRVLNSATIASVAEIDGDAVSEDTTAYGETFVANGASVSGDSVLYDVVGGYDGASYVVKITVNLTGGGKLTGVQRVECSIGYET